jgi:hypothetical protein
MKNDIMKLETQPPNKGEKAPPVCSYATNLAGNIYLCKNYISFIFNYLFFRPELLMKWQGKRT